MLTWNIISTPVNISMIEQPCSSSTPTMPTFANPDMNCASMSVVEQPDQSSTNIPD